MTNLPQETVIIWRENLLPPSETFIVNQVEALSRWRGVVVGLKRMKQGLSLPAAYAPLPYNLWGRGIARAGLGHVVAGRRLLDYFQAAKASVIHAHFGPGGLSMMPYAERLRLPLVTTFHGMDITSRRLSASYYGALPELFLRSNQLVAVSRFIASRLIEAGAPPEKIKVLPIGIDIPRAPAARRASNILFVGRLVEKKGVPDLLHAVAQLPEEMRRTRVDVVGFGPLERDLKGLAEKLRLDVKFWGRQSPERVAQMMATAKIFCGPSRAADDGDAEGLGMVFLEAAAAGLPIVAYRHGGVPEAVLDQKTGLLASEGNVAELSANLHRLLQDDDLAARLGRHGRSFVVQHFDLRTCTRHLEELYDECAQASGGVPT